MTLILSEDQITQMCQLLFKVDDEFVNCGEIIEYKVDANQRIVDLTGTNTGGRYVVGPSGVWTMLFKCKIKNPDTDVFEKLGNTETGLGHFQIKQTYINYGIQIYESRTFFISSSITGSSTERPYMEIEIYSEYVELKTF